MNTRDARFSTLMKELRHPVRLPILIALQEQELSASELAERLGVPFDTVAYAVRSLARAGLIKLVRTEPTGPSDNTLRRVYRSKQSGWDKLAEHLAEFVPDAPSGGSSKGGRAGNGAG